MRTSTARRLDRRREGVACVGTGFTFPYSQGMAFLDVSAGPVSLPTTHQSPPATCKDPSTVYCDPLTKREFVREDQMLTAKVSTSLFRSSFL